jgi:hypothetical protein
MNELGPIQRLQRNLESIDLSERGVVVGPLNDPSGEFGPSPFAVEGTSVVALRLIGLCHFFEDPGGAPDLRYPEPPFKTRPKRNDAIYSSSLSWETSLSK